MVVVRKELNPILAPYFRNWTISIGGFLTNNICSLGDGRAVFNIGSIEDWFSSHTDTYYSRNVAKILKRYGGKLIVDTKGNLLTVVLPEENASEAQEAYQSIF